MTRIVHLGLGQFHRAHQAWYTQMAGGDWRITGVAMRDPTVFEALRHAPGYDLVTLGPDGYNTTRIAVHDRVLLAAAAPGDVVDALANNATQVVTLTITEKGYGLTPEGTLNLSRPEIATDLTASSPRTAIGMLTQALHRRQRAGKSPITALSCDNLSGNGAGLRQAVIGFSRAAGLDLDPDRAARFPNAMVDRITPAMTGAVQATLEETLHKRLHAPVLTEAFSDWVIEDRFAQGHPDWARAGAKFVADVHPFEQRKLLFLNGAHSALAYLGRARGLTYVHEAIGDPELRRAVDTLWQEATPLIAEAAAADLDAYRARLIDRFAVPQMKHALAQIAQDGSVKLAQRILPVLRHHGFAAPAARAALVAWMRDVTGAARQGAAIADPHADSIRDAVAPGRSATDRRTALLACLGIASDEPPDGWIDALPVD